MEDYKFLIYIALSILYFLFKGIGKKKKPVIRKKTNTADSTTHEKPKSFEEILAELTGQKREEELQELEDAEEVPYEPYKSPLNTEVEERPLNQTVSDEEYENADSTLKELYRKGEKLKTIDELVDIKETEITSAIAADSSRNKTNNLASEIRNDFDNPDTVKKAFIYSEIFNRKY